MNLGEQFRSEEIDFVPGWDEDILVVDLKGDGHACGQGPRCRGPDDYGDILSGKGRKTLRGVGHRIRNVDGGGRLVFVFDFGRRQGRLAIDAPVDGLETLVDKTLLYHVCKGPELGSFVFGLVCDVGVVPVPQDSKSLEFLPLDVDVPPCVIGALGSKDDGVHRFLRSPFFLEHPQLDRQSMGVPSRDVGGLVAAHPLVLGNEVLEYLVEGGADVDVGIGVRWPVVKDEKRPSL